MFSSYNSNTNISPIQNSTPPPPCFAKVTGKAIAAKLGHEIDINQGAALCSYYFEALPEDIKLKYLSIYLDSYSNRNPLSEAEIAIQNSLPPCSSKLVCVDFLKDCNTLLDAARRAQFVGFCALEYVKDNPNESLKQYKNWAEQNAHKKAHSCCHKIS